MSFFNASNTSSGDSKVEQLTEKNYITWQRKMRMLLKDKELWWILTDSKDESKCPEHLEKLLKEKPHLIQSARQHAAHLISNSIHESQYFLILTLDDSDPKVLWEAIAKHFEPKTEQSIRILLDSFASLKQEQGEDVAHFVARINELAIRISRADSSLKEMVNDQYKKVRLLNGLLPHFSTAVTSIDMSNAKRSFTEYVELLQSYETKHKEEFITTKAMVAEREKIFNPARDNYVRGRGGGRSYRGFRGRGRSNYYITPRYCFVCGMTNHVATHCRNKAPPPLHAPSRSSPPTSNFAPTVSI